LMTAVGPSLQLVRLLLPINQPPVSLGSETTFSLHMLSVLQPS